MATWKKVIVSGSQAELAAVTASSGVRVGTNQQIGTTQATTFLSGSFTGSFAGNGASLTGIVATVYNPTNLVTDVDSNTRFFISKSIGNEYVTYANLLTDLAGTAATSNLVNSGNNNLALSSQISVTGVSASFTGSLTGVLIGTASWASQAVTASYVTGSIFTGANSALSASFALSSSRAVTSSFAITASYVTGSIFSGGNSALSASYALTASYVASPTLANSLTQGTGITTFTYNGSAPATVAISASTLTADRILKWTGTAFANSQITDDGTTVAILGNLEVRGTTTTVSSSNLLVSDKFILLSSGSTTSTTEGGIIVQNAANGTGSALFYEGSETRWALATAVGSTDGTATRNSWIVSVSASSGNPGGDPIYGGASFGFGNMYIDSSLTNATDNNIWIYA